MGRINNNSRDHRYRRQEADLHSDETMPAFWRNLHTWRWWQHYLLVALFAAGAYTNATCGDLVHDDVLAIVNNRDVHVNVTSWLQVFKNDFWGRDIRHKESHKSYRPLCVLTFRLNFLLSGLDPWGYHVTNIALHVVASALYLAFCRLHVFRFRCRPQWAMLAAAMFAVHPVHTEAVSGVVGRADVLASILFLISLMAFIRFVDAESRQELLGKWQHSGLFIICIVTGSAAMFVKETGITVFGVCLLYDVLVINFTKLKGIFLRRPYANQMKMKPFLVRTAVIIVNVSLLLGVRWSLMDGHLPPFTDQDNPAAFSKTLLTRILTYWHVYARNIYLLARPATLSYDWQMGSVPLVENLLDVRNLMSCMFIVLLSFLIYRAVVRSQGGERQRLVLGITMLIVPFLPATNLFFTVGFVLAERILYVPSMGYIILVVEGLRRLTTLEKPPRRRSTALVYAALLLGGVWTGRTAVRNQVWLSRYHLFRSGLETLPQNAKMHYNYGNLMKDTGQEAAAVLHYREAIRLWPTYASSHNNLGTMVKDPQDAEHHYREAIRINPRHAGAFFNLGNLLLEEERLEEAVEALNQSIAIADDSADTHTSMASAMTRLGRHLQAEAHYARAVELSPEGADYHNNYGVFLNQRGRAQEALVTYERAIELNSRHHVAMVNAARMLRQLGRMEHAEDYLIRALSIERDAETLDYTGIFFFNQGQNERALKLFQEAFERNPNSTEGRIHYAQALNLAGDHESARQHLAAVLSSTSTHPEALHQMANVHGLQGDHLQAIEYLGIAIKHCNYTEDLATLYFELGNHQKDVSSYVEALQSYLKAVEINPDIGEAHLNIGVIYHIQGEYSEAMKHYTIAEKLLPNHQLLQDNMRKLQRKFHREGG